MPIDNTVNRSPRVSSKGSMIVHTGTATAEIAVGTNSTYFIANSAASVGINWATTAAFAAPKIESIYSNTTTVAVSSIDITDIPQTYEGLLIEISNASTTAATNTDNIQINFNSSSASYWYISAAATSQSGIRAFGRNTSAITIDYTIGGSSYTSVISGGSPGSLSAQIPGYRTDKNKSIAYRSRAGAYVLSGSGSWKSTAAITRILITFSQVVASGVNVTLYGTNV